MERINREAVFCDETEDYRSPCEADAGEEVTFYFRTEKDGADCVELIEYENGAERARRPLEREHSEGRFDYFACRMTAGQEPLFYAFCIRRGEDVCYYSRVGETERPGEAPFRLTPGFHVPAWSRGAVMYQIYVDRFCNGDPSNDVETNEYIYLKKPVQKAASWDELPQEMDVRRFYGGDLKGVWEKLEYLKGLKVEAIYLNPIFVSPSNHKYDCQDYDHVDPHFGVIVDDADGLVAPDALDNDNAEK